MSKIYFVRHATPDYSVHDDSIRPLTDKGMDDSKKVTEFLSDKDIHKIYSSPYKRSVDTVSDFAKKYNLNIELIDDFRERKISDYWIDDFKSYSKNQWEDFEYKLEHGESLREVQVRNINELRKILKNHSGENIVIGTHGIALSTIINFYKSDFDYSEFKRISGIMPWIVCINFDNDKLVDIEEFICETIEFI